MLRLLLSTWTGEFFSCGSHRSIHTNNLEAVDLSCNNFHSIKCGGLNNMLGEGIIPSFCNWAYWFQCDPSTPTTSGDTNSALRRAINERGGGCWEHDNYFQRAYKVELSLSLKFALPCTCFSGQEEPDRNITGVSLPTEHEFNPAGRRSELPLKSSFPAPCGVAFKLNFVHNHWSLGYLSEPKLSC